jgi:tRNA-(ms[2]io[6]A)-hydroxylase
MRDLVRKDDPGRLVDVLIVGAIIEARSCERFAALAPHLDEKLSEFYTGLLRSEARHYQDYLKLAVQANGAPVDERVGEFMAVEKALIEEADTEFRFHSGPVSA